MKKSYWLVLIGLIISAFIIALYNHNWILEMEGAAALISALAFLGLLLSLDKQQEAIKQQSLAIDKQDRALEMQREELALQREEMRLTRSEMVNQNTIFTIQKFESTFFNMLSIHNDIVKNLTIVNKPMWKGREVFHFLVDEIHGTFNNLNIERVIKDKSDLQRNELVSEAIHRGIYDYMKDINHYFNHFKSILQLLNFQSFENNIVNDYHLKFKYFNFLKNQLSDKELMLIYYVSIYTFTNESIRILEKFTLLEQLPILELFEDIPLILATSAYLKPKDIELFLKIIDREDFLESLKLNKTLLFNFPIL